MDTEKIEELVVRFMNQLVEEFNQLGKGITANAENARKEVQALGLSEEDASDLVFFLADPMKSIETSQQRCRMHVSNIYDILDGLDPEEEELACVLIHQGLRELHSEIAFLFSSHD